MKKIFNNLEEIISGFFLSLTILLVILNVILRYFFNEGLTWAEEVATGSFVWSVFIGASAAYKHKMHIGIDMLIKLLPSGLKNIIELIIGTFMVLINFYVLYLSYIFIGASKGKLTPVLELPSTYISSAIFVGFAFMSFHSLRFLYYDLQNDAKKEVE